MKLISKMEGQLEIKQYFCLVICLKAFLCKDWQTKVNISEEAIHGQTLTFRTTCPVKQIASRMDDFTCPEKKEWKQENSGIVTDEMMNIYSKIPLQLDFSDVCLPIHDILYLKLIKMWITYMRIYATVRVPLLTAPLRWRQRSVSSRLMSQKWA